MSLLFTIDSHRRISFLEFFLERSVTSIYIPTHLLRESPTKQSSVLSYRNERTWFVAFMRPRVCAYVRTWTVRSSYIGKLVEIFWSQCKFDRTSRRRVNDEFWRVDDDDDDDVIHRRRRVLILCDCTHVSSFTYTPSICELHARVRPRVVSLCKHRVNACDEEYLLSLESFRANETINRSLSFFLFSFFNGQVLIFLRNYYQLYFIYFIIFCLK